MNEAMEIAAALVGRLYPCDRDGCPGTILCVNRTENHMPFGWTLHARGDDFAYAAFCSEACAHAFVAHLEMMFGLVGGSVGHGLVGGRRDQVRDPDGEGALWDLLSKEGIAIIGPGEDVPPR